ncbi:hypothetical protein PAMP_024922 [Pampus punctatissimus]
MDRSTENTNPEVEQKMRCHKRTADAETDPRDEFCRASPATSAATDSTKREVKMLRSQTDIIQERKDVKRKQKDPIEDDKGGNLNEPRRSKLTSPPHQWISMKRLLNVENSLAFGIEMLPAFSKSSYSFSSYYSLPASHTASSSSSLSVSQTHKSRDQRHGPNLSFLPPIDKGLFALLRDADFYCSTKTYTLAVGSLNTALQTVLVPRSVLTADWLYCLLGGTESHISTQLKLYWQAMLYKAQAKEKDVSVMYTPYTGEPADKDISQAEEAFVKHHPTFTGFIYTDPRGGHVLPQTTDWLSAPGVTKHYLITMGFRRREDGLFLKKMHSRIWPSFTGVCAGSGLIEWLQYSSLLFKLGDHREHSTILHCCQAQLVTAPYLPQISTQQEITLVGCLEDLIHSLGRKYLHKKAQRHQCRRNTDKVQIKQMTYKYLKLMNKRR